MKKLFYLSLLLSLSLAAQSQEVNKEDKKKIEDIEETKTMDRQGLLANYFQGVVKNLLSEDKAIQLKASLFALSGNKESKFSSENYYKSHFARNTQVKIGGGANKNGKFNAFNAGFSYNLLNRRDSSEIDIFKLLQGNKNFNEVNGKLMKIHTDLTGQYSDAKTAELEGALISISEKAVKSKDTLGLRSSVINLLKKGQVKQADTDIRFSDTYKNFAALVVRAVNNGRLPQSIDAPATELTRLAEFLTVEYYSNPMRNALRKYVDDSNSTGLAAKNTDSNVNDLEFNQLVIRLDKAVADDPVFKEKKIAAAYMIPERYYKLAILKISRKALIVLDYDYTHASTGILNKHIPSLTYSKGFRGFSENRGGEFSIKLSDSINTDTSKMSVAKTRNIASAQVGASFVVLTDNSKVSLLELKFAGEYNRVFDGIYSGEKRDLFFANLSIQARPSPKSPWLKLDFKYNKGAGFLGFLDVTFNLDSPKN